ncbi:MAG: hypothetical protein HYX59_04845 [Elusimicrobia bacterium]|nr:hypothetical protein [Elusimicrobiota bacterium]
MNRSITAVLALLVTCGGVRAGAEAMRSDAEPRLEISRLSGKIEVETPGRKESVPGQMLPYIRSGSMAIMGVEADPKALEVVVGGEKFQLKRGGRLELFASGPDEVTASVDRGEAKIAARATPAHGVIRPTARTMTAGDSLIVAVPEDQSSAAPAMSLADVEVSRRNETTFTAQGEGRTESRQAGIDAARKAVSDWPTPSRMAAEAMIEKYGIPDAIDAETASWNDKGSWKRTSVHRDGTDFLEQTIGYAVPEEKRADLEKMGLMLKVGRADRELSATSASEEANYLALNLADEVIREKRTPEDAREFYMETVKLSRAGKTSPYMQGLMFRP